MENDPDNPCFGCGPNNPIGLGLRFFEEGKLVFTQTVFADNHSARPGQVHAGVIFAALECTCSWTFYAFKRLATLTERYLAIDFVSKVAVRTPVRLEGRIMRETPEPVTVRAELLQGGVVRAFMEQEVRVVKSKEEFRKLRPAAEITRVLEEMLPP